MRFLFLSLLLVAEVLSAQPFTTRFETSGGTQTPTYPEIIAWWKALDAASPYIKMQEMGPTDAGYPLHLVLVSADKDFDIASLKRKKKSIIFILNGIHPGEPDGIDASMLLVRDMIQSRIGSGNKQAQAAGQPAPFPDSVVLALVPVYNIGGALNRSANYRVDQNGPEEFGFRGNSQNLDLNRDFIKCDSREALTFSRIFHYLDPDVFVDNHVSNGADYQHVMTLITAQHNRVGGVMGDFLTRSFEPALFRLMKEKGFDLVPYVNHSRETPDKGWAQFWDSPRYSSGYATLWHTFAFVPETHMLKPYPQRVAATRALMESFIRFTAANGTTIRNLRAATRGQYRQQERFPIAWKWDPTRFTEIDFKGYEPAQKPSAISGQPRLYYDRSRPIEKKVPFYNFYVDTLSVERPPAYLIPQGWWKVIDRLKANGVTLLPLEKDTVIEVEAYRIEQYQAAPRPFEGHHLNREVRVSKSRQRIPFRKGDFLVPLNGPANRFLVETLEPQGEDSYFAWNFFDPILGQKEGFSDYVFEETAAALLASKPELKARLEERKSSDSAFARNGAAQLDFIYRNSPYYEPAHLRYPVYRIVR